LLVHADDFVPAEPMVPPAESHMDPPLTAPVHSSFEPTVDAPSPWRLYRQAQVHVLEMVDGRVIHMFVDVSYPLSVGTMECMLKHGLEVSRVGFNHTTNGFQLTMVNIQERVDSP
nr:hypothetical protein [Tanacetum cinerariifolium]